MLVKPGEYMGSGSSWSVTPERAVGWFDMNAPGWVPQWFPTEIVFNARKDDERRVRISPKERLAWFDQALACYAKTQWPPAGTLKDRKRAVILSLLAMLYDLEVNNHILRPDEM